MSHTSFPSIGGLHNVVKTFEVYPHFFPETLVYRGKPKLHGTNAGVRVTADGVVSQSRSNDLSITDDNAGFAKWVADNEHFFRLARAQAERDIVVFGEWAGPGIQKGTACNLVEEKFFAIFVIYRLGSDEFDADMIADPDIIEMIVEHERPKNVYVLPWWGEPITVQFSDRDSLLRAADIANAVVAEYELNDGWMKNTFGVDGIGEGIVYYPEGVTSRQRFGDFAFKAKGAKHKVVKTRESVQIDPEVAASVDAFVEMFVTPARLDQGLTEIGGKADPKLTGQFLAWIGRDVEKESVDELEASGLEWKMVAKAIGTKARGWYLPLANSI